MLGAVHRKERRVVRKRTGPSREEKKPRVESENERIEKWRFNELVRMGYPPDAALQISSRHDIDLHKAITLIKKGCPPKTALEILL